MHRMMNFALVSALARTTPVIAVGVVVFLGLLFAFLLLRLKDQEGSCELRIGPFSYAKNRGERKKRKPRRTARRRSARNDPSDAKSTT